MRVSVCIGTFGEASWQDTAALWALPSVEGQGAEEVLVRHEPEGTLASCRNALAREARGDWLCFLDADDALGPGYLDAMGKSMPEGRALLYPAVQFVAHRRQAIKRPRMIPEMDLRTGNFMVIGTLVQREVFEEVGGFHEWSLYEDWCLWQRCWKVGAIPRAVPEAVYVAQMRAGSRNRSPSRSEKLRLHFEIVAANFPEYAAT